MNKSLQILEENLQLYPRIFSWHPLYAEMNGNTPCYYEFMNLMECINSNNNKTNNTSMLCLPKYYKLLECIKENGLNFK